MNQYIRVSTIGPYCRYWRDLFRNALADKMSMLFLSLFPADILPFPLVSLLPLSLPNGMNDRRLGGPFSRFRLAFWPQHGTNPIHLLLFLLGRLVWFNGEHTFDGD